LLSTRMYTITTTFRQRQNRTKSGQKTRLAAVKNFHAWRFPFELNFPRFGSRVRTKNFHVFDFPFEQNSFAFSIKNPSSLTLTGVKKKTQILPNLWTMAGYISPFFFPATRHIPFLNICSKGGDISLYHNFTHCDISNAPLPHKRLQPERSNRSGWSTRIFYC